METKLCRDCGATKPASDFTRQSKGTALQPYCRPCASIRAAANRRRRLDNIQGDAEQLAAERARNAAAKAAYRAANPDKAQAERARGMARDRADAAAFLWRKAKARAERKGIPFTITIEDVTVPDVCPVFGAPLTFGGAALAGNSPSIDRHIPALGYIPGNVRVMSHRANRLKSDATLAEVRSLLAYLEAS